MCQNSHPIKQVLFHLFQLFKAVVMAQTHPNLSSKILCFLSEFFYVCHICFIKVDVQM